MGWDAYENGVITIVRMLGLRIGLRVRYSSILEILVKIVIAGVAVHANERDVVVGFTRPSFLGASASCDGDGRSFASFVGGPHGVERPFPC